MTYFKLSLVVAVLGALAMVPRQQPHSVAAYQPTPPDSSRFTHMTLAEGFDEPMQMAILPNLDVLVVERKGAVRLYDAQERQLKTIAHFNVFSGIEDGLLGVAADPKFSTNHWVYFYYGLGGERNVSQLVRYELQGEKLIETSKKVLLEVPTQRTYCCHSAGYLTFGSDGLLYLSIGDNTNAEEIEGHNPTDERPGRQLADGQGTSANSNDLRGKILRIKPEADGTYTIPEGNLFPKDGSKGRPEIYVMGCRNPFRVSVDPKNSFVYWGDVGPDTQVPAEEGTMSYDEINQARKPGFFGYPYFLGNNEAFPKYDFATKKEGPKQDPAHPVNRSPNNTGVKELPPAQPAMIWYGKGPSKRWPMVGKGGASAMAGPVYYSDLYPNAPYKLPAYYNGKLFIYEWIRHWIMAVTLDEQGNYVKMEPFLPQLNVVAPMDMQMASDGAIYLLAYGTNWFAKNTDAGLIRVEYAEGNRKPMAAIQVDKRYGGLPLTVHLSAAASKDYDPADTLSFRWKIGTALKKGRELTHTFTKPGLYQVTLTATDPHGAQGFSTVAIKVGNTPPEVRIDTKSNRTFYWDKTTLDYEVKVRDVEDQKIDPSRVSVAFHYLTFGKDLASVLSAGESPQFAATQKLYNSLDCKACHALDTKSIGPSLNEISKRYHGKTHVKETLSQKIIKGGSGNWGTYPMPPHPNLSTPEADELVGYILSLAEQKPRLPLKGNLPLNQHPGKGKEGAYVLRASYTDRGARGIEPLEASAQLVLRDPLIQLEDYHEGNVGVTPATLQTNFVSYIRSISEGKYVRFNQLDLQHVKRIRFRVQPDGPGGSIEIRLDSRTGPVVGTVEIPAGKQSSWQEFTAPIQAKPGLHDWYIVFRNPKAGWVNLFNVDWMVVEKE
ncbi:PQQ-dependent sugar dehydrogenase [Siphonobacter sp. BAB-5405]|nr:PQQ-dependent sugar dehydrogenase [Siphonobacter sp. BAB-5405]